MGTSPTADAEIVVGEKVKLSEVGHAQGLQGKALSDIGEVVTVEGNLIRVRREGIKTVKVYAAGMWQKMTPSSDMADMVAAMKALGEDRVSDWANRLIFADFLEEQGKTIIARAWRFMGKFEKRPWFRDDNGLSKRYSWHPCRWTRFHDDGQSPGYALLPPVLLVTSSGYVPDRVRFVTEDEAVNYLAGSLERLRKLSSLEEIESPKGRSLFSAIE